ncbi:MAG: hypothetical protein OXB95_13025 [Rhodobacteraceae bacterium]|nr:hypothetical protein [Paracoccaceae bacterium]
MNDIASERVGPMRNPPHLGELIRESMEDMGWNVTKTAARLGCGRVGDYGAGVGGHRLGHCRSLDADAGELRACAGAARPDGCGSAREDAARTIEARAVGSGWFACPCRELISDSGLDAGANSFL